MAIEMKVLLDSHILLWALYEPEKLSEEAREIILEPRNDICVSSASLWEIEIKHIKRPSSMPYGGRKLAEAITLAGYRILSLSAEHIRYLDTFAAQGIHNDPFDHVLLSVSKFEQALFITHDELIARYSGALLLLS